MVMAVNFDFVISDTFRKYTGYNNFVIVVEIHCMSHFNIFTLHYYKMTLAKMPGGMSHTITVLLVE